MSHSDCKLCFQLLTTRIVYFHPYVTTSCRRYFLLLTGYSGPLKERHADTYLQERYGTALFVDDTKSKAWIDGKFLKAFSNNDTACHGNVCVKIAGSSNVLHQSSSGISQIRSYSKRFQNLESLIIPSAPSPFTPLHSGKKRTPSHYDVKRNKTHHYSENRHIRDYSNRG